MGVVAFICQGSRWPKHGPQAGLAERRCAVSGRACAAPAYWCNSPGRMYWRNHSPRWPVSAGNRPGAQDSSTIRAACS